MSKIDDLKQGYYETPGNYIKDAFDLLGRYTGGFIGFLILALILYSAVGEIPILGGWLQLLSSVLFAGFYLVGQRIEKQRDYEFRNFFDGFKHSKMIHLVLISIVSSIIFVVLMIPMFIPYLSYFWEYFSSGMEAEDILALLVSSNFEFTGLMLFGFGMIIPIFYLSIAWMWAPFFVLFKDMNFWDAMETSRQIITRKWWHFFGFLLLLILLNIGGTLLLGFGLLWTIPATSLAIYISFERIVGTTIGEEDYEDEIIKHLVD